MRPQKNLGPNFFQFPCVCPNSLLPKLKPRFNESCRKEDGRISCSTFQVNEWYFLSADIKGHPSKMCLNYLLYKTKYPAKFCRFVKTIARSFWEYRFYFAMMCEKSQGGWGICSSIVQKLHFWLLLVRQYVMKSTQMWSAIGHFVHSWSYFLNVVNQKKGSSFKLEKISQ